MRRTSGYGTFVLSRSLTHERSLVSTSMDGLRCYDCPTGAQCNMTVRRATETLGVEFGTTSPRTSEGFYLFNAPQSKQVRTCDPAQWAADDPCKAFVTPGANISDVLSACATSSEFRKYWSADRVFSCVAGKAFYVCEVRLMYRVCLSDVMIRPDRSHTLVYAGCFVRSLTRVSPTSQSRRSQRRQRTARARTATTKRSARSAQIGTRKRRTTRACVRIEHCDCCLWHAMRD